MGGLVSTRKTGLFLGYILPHEEVALFDGTGKNQRLDTYGRHAIRTEDEETRQPVVVDFDELNRLEVRASLAGYISQVCSRLDFIIADARGKAFRTTRDYKWWKFWIVASPLLDALLYGTLFGFLLRTNRGIDNYVGFLLLGIVFFTLMNKMLMAGSGLIQANRSLIRAFTFPRSTIVFSQSLRYIIDTIPSMVIAISMALAFQYTVPLHWEIILVIPVIILMLVFSTGLMFIVARITAFFPDFRALMELFSRGWLFLSGVFYSLERFKDRPAIYEVMTSNPAHVFLDAIRGTVMRGDTLDWNHWCVMIAWGLGTFLFGFIFFWLAEQRYSRLT